jgi:hypothetical protein
MRTDRQTDRCDEANVRFSQFCDSASLKLRSMLRLDVELVVQIHPKLLVMMLSMSGTSPALTCLREVCFSACGIVCLS